MAASCGGGPLDTTKSGDEPPDTPEPVAVTIAAIGGVTPPALGAFPMSLITETAEYSGNVKWSPEANDGFASSTKYTATITLFAKTGYTFEGVAANFFTVAGGAATNAAGSGVVTAVFPVTSALSWASVATGWGHSVALDTDGRLWAWGSNYSGQLGLGDTTDHDTPRRVGLTGDWASVAAGDSHTVALKMDGSLWVWGQNDKGQLGLGDTTDRGVPTRVGNETGWASVEARMNHNVALKADRSLWTWGQNDKGQLGLGDTTDRGVPTRVGGDTGDIDWASVAAGDSHTIALKTTGSLWVWGSNSSGQLGLGDTTDHGVPTRVGGDTGDTDWASVTAGDYYTIALKTSGYLYAWGNNDSGQLGHGSKSYTPQVTPTRVEGHSDWASTAAGYQHTVAVKKDGSLWAWGDNYHGELGLGHTINWEEPRRVGGITGDTDWAAVVAGYAHTIAVKTDGTIWAWGSNSSGELGLGDTPDSTAPMRVVFP